MDEEDLNYKLLRQIQQTEQTTPTLSRVDLLFYSKLSEYLRRLDSLSVTEHDPQKHKLIQDETQNIKKIALGIYEHREKKIVHAALSASRGGKPDLKNLLDSEKILYENLLDVITQTRNTIFIKPMVQPPQKTKQNTPLPQPVEHHQKPEQNQTPIVSVTTDIPEFVGTDLRTYQLHKDDVLTLPQEMAVPLQKRDVIKRIK